MKYIVTYFKDHSSKAKIKEIVIEVEAECHLEANNKADQIMQDKGQNPDNWPDVDIELYKN